MAKRDKKQKIALTASTPVNNPFAAALAGMTAPVAAADQVEEAAPVTRRGLDIKTRVERKGRGGKTVTLVEGLEDVDPDELDELAAGLRKALGTGVSREGAILVAQGDMGPRITAWFAAQQK